MRKRGRPQKPYETSWGEIVPGLTRCADGRWRIAATEERFTEHDERRAVAKAKLILERLKPSETIHIEAAVETSPFELAAARGNPVTAAVRKLIHLPNGDPLFDSLDNADGEIVAAQVVDPNILWPWLREQLIARPEWIAQKVGIPELASLARFDLPKASIKLARLRDVYVEHNESLPASKREAAKTFDDFMAITRAQTLADLTVEVLKRYRNEIKGRVKSPGTIGSYFGRCKYIIVFGKSEGEDAKEIDAALSRMAILKAPKDKRTHRPSPISREDFHSVCLASRQRYPNWELRLMLMLNLCLHFEECLDLEWTDFNLDAGTFCTNRNKLGRVIRAAVLWPETLALLKAIKRTGCLHVFVSTHGRRFSAKGQWKTWNKIRKAAGCPDVQLDDIRDGSYTAACNGKDANGEDIDEKYARLLAGHRSHGLQDNYVARNPGCVKLATDAVYRAYFG